MHMQYVQFQVIERLLEINLFMFLYGFIDVNVHSIYLKFSFHINIYLS